MMPFKLSFIPMSIYTHMLNFVCINTNFTVCVSV